MLGAPHDVLHGQTFNPAKTSHKEPETIDKENITGQGHSSIEILQLRMHHNLVHLTGSKGMYFALPQMD